MRVILFLICIHFLFQDLTAQNQYSGQVIDSESEKPLAFVNVIIPGSHQGTTTDIDGKFSLYSNDSIDSIQFSYVGYKQLKVATPDLLNDPVIEMDQVDFKLAEVEILPGVNPAHRLIELAVKNKDLNNPEKSTEFSYESYNKLVFTGSFDSTVTSKKDSLHLLDSNTREAYETLQKMHLFMMESVSKRDHIPPDLSKEVVVASRVSGLEHPSFSLIGTQLQSFSFYSNYISLFGSNYLSPISKGSINKYLFVLEDTLYDGADTIFTIRFQPRKGKNFDGMYGQLQINTNTYAIQSVKAEPVDQEDVYLKVQQKYEFIEGKQWFPVQLNTDIVFKNIDIDEFDVVGIGRSYIRNIDLSSKLTKREIGNTVLSVDPKAGYQDSAYWAINRSSPLDKKEEETYRLVDSVGKEVNMDRYLKVTETLVRGNIPLGPIDFPLNRLLDYNDYEGARLGLGVESNDRLVRNFRIGGYGAYGTKDKAWKYGGYGLWTPESKNHFRLRFGYAQEVIESGGTQFTDDRYPTLSNEGLKKLYVSRMDQIATYHFDFSLNTMRDFRLSFIGNRQDRQFTNDYLFLDASEGVISPIDQFNHTSAAIDLRYSYKEKYAEMFGRRFPVESKYPILRFRYTKGLKNLLDGDFGYDRLDLKFDHSILWRNIGVSSIRLQGGMINGNIPLTLQYRTEGTYSSGLLLATEYSFETVRPNEFYSDRYFNVFFRHNFKSLLFKTEEFDPQIAILASYGIGELTQTLGQHQNVDFKTLERGLIETGLAINNIYKLDNTAFGVAGFYRLGYYSDPDWKENILVKLSLVLAF